MWLAVTDVSAIALFVCFIVCNSSRSSQYLVLLILSAYTHRYDMAEAVPRVRNFGYTNAEYRDMLGVYFACNLVNHAAAAEYRRLFPNRRQPDAATFQRVWDRTGETGYVGVRNPDGGRQRRARNENDEAILDCFAEDPTTSLRRTARFLDTSYSTCQRVMKDDGQHAFKYRRIHEICKYIRIVSFRLFSRVACFVLL